MQPETLEYIKNGMESIGVPYEFMQYGSEISETEFYFSGEYNETGVLTEDGQEETNFILTGTGRCSFLDLENAKKKIKNLFPPIGGNRAILPGGAGVVIMYDSAFPLKSVDAEIKRIQINLTVKEWMVN